MDEEHSIPAPSLSFKALEPAILPRASPRYKEAPWKEPSFRNGRFNDRNNEELHNSDHLETNIWKDRCSWEKNAWHKKIHKSYNNVIIYIFNFSTQPSSTLTWQVHMVYQRYSPQSSISWMKKAKVLWQRDRKNYVSESPELVAEMFKRFWWRNVAFHSNHKPSGT